MVSVTLPLAGTEPFQVTVLPVVEAVPEVAAALDRLRPAGRVSVNSSPTLSREADTPALLMMMV